MPLYEGPPSEFEGNYIETKFIRIASDIYTTEFGDTEIIHDAFAGKEGLIEEIDRRKIEQPETVDGGYYTIFKLDPPQIVIGSSSSSLKIPVTSTARDVTLVLFQEKSLGCIVENEEEYRIYET
jgi:hypothetical protein